MKVWHHYLPELRILFALLILTGLVFIYGSAIKGLSDIQSLAFPTDIFFHVMGGQLFLLPVFFSICYFLFKILERIFSGHKLPAWKKEALICTFAYMTLTIALSLVYAIAVKLTFIVANPQWASKVSQKFMEWDLLLLGNFTQGQYPAYAFNWVGKSAILEFLSLLSYSELMSLVGLSYLGLFLLSRPLLLRKFVVAFFACSILALPIWLIFPSVSPHHMFGENIFQIEIPSAISNTLSDQPPSRRLEFFLNFSDKFWLDPHNQFYPVSTNPSMHMAWAIIILVFIFRASRRLAIILVIPWFLLNLLGTMYTLQHYFIDLISGGILAGISIWLADRCFNSVRSDSQLTQPALGKLIRSDFVRHQTE